MRGPKHSTHSADAERLIDAVLPIERLPDQQFRIHEVVRGEYSYWPTRSGALNSEVDCQLEK